MRRGLTQADAAGVLDISPQAMSQRLRAAGWDLEPDSLDLLADALAEADRLHAVEQAPDGEVAR